MNSVVRDNAVRRENLRYGNKMNTVAGEYEDKIFSYIGSMSYDT